MAARIGVLQSGHLWITIIKGGVMQKSKRIFMEQLGSAVVLAGMAALPATAQDKAKTAAKKSYGRKVLFENDKVVATEVTTPPGAESDMRVRKYFRVVRVLRGGTQERVFADGKKERRERKTGEVYGDGPDKVAFKAVNVGKTDYAIYVVQLK